MHIGKKNLTHDYFIPDSNNDNLITIENSFCEKDLGFNFSANLKWKQHVIIPASEVNQILGMIKGTFSYKDKQIFKVFYNLFVRPHFENGIAVWSPYPKGYTYILERVQRQATKLTSSLKNIKYEEKLINLYLTKLSTQCLKSDLIQNLKIINKINSVNPTLHGYNFLDPVPAQGILPPEARSQFPALTTKRQYIKKIS
ncbi:uncharacterized protein LOC136088056 [Hydra vulgaris]|uniref:Uncharacterized protein LOC136088056 n=1 Tax=Hydra vulgaris TaxID=6087 RepID=A0ABM4D0N4_HYDVU